jgi:hypothetical protein
MPMSPRLLRPRQTSKYASLRTGLVAYWPLNETATSGDVTAEDWTKRGNNFTSNNSVLSASGLVNNCREFVTGNSEYLSITSNSDVQFGEAAYTLALWFNVPAAATGHMAIFGKDQDTGREFECSYNRLTNVLEVVPYTSSGSGVTISINGVARDTWHFLCIRHAVSSATVNVRLNTSDYSGSRSGSATYNSTATQFRIGARSYPGFLNYLTGKVDEIAKWSRSLSDSEVSKLYNSGAGIDLRK